MSDELRFPGPSGPADRDSLSDPVKDLIRNAYEPPVAAADSDAYWAGLEHRVMARVRSEGDGDGRWWSALAPWARAGLVAAVAVVAITGLINRRLADSDSQYASQYVYESVVQTPTPEADASAAILSAPELTTGSDATVDYVLSH